MMGGGGGKGGSGAADAARAEEQARQARIREGTQKVNELFDGQFTDDFYGQRRQGYLDYATPQLEDQYQQALKELTYSLDRAGTSDSSIRAARMGELQKLYDTNTRYVSDTGLNHENDARNNVEQARSNLISQLNATADVSGAVNSANSRAAALSAQQGYSPLGQLFSAFTNTLGTQAAYERSAAIGGAKPYINTGLFAPSQNAVTVTQ
ncbi:MAG: hypothetical protein HYU59_05740 [Magnetospirillum gryphiswaldense]|nr:hypothetical protein [Magnetospirillum gryphiswaldense]